MANPYLQQVSDVGSGLSTISKNLLNLANQDYDTRLATLKGLQAFDPNINAERLASNVGELQQWINPNALNIIGAYSNIENQARLGQDVSESVNKYASLYKNLPASMTGQYANLGSTTINTTPQGQVGYAEMVAQNKLAQDASYKAGQIQTASVPNLNPQGVAYRNNNRTLISNEPKAGYIKAYDTDQNYKEVYVPKGVYVPGVSASPKPGMTATMDVSSPVKLDGTTVGTGAKEIISQEATSEADRVIAEMEAQKKIKEATQTPQEKQDAELLTQQLAQIAGIEGKAAYKAQLEQAQLDPIEKQVNSLTIELATLKADKDRLTAENLGKPITMNSIIGAQAQIDFMMNSKILGISGMINALNGNIERATKSIERSIDAKYGVLEEKLAITKAQRDALAPTLTKQEAERAAALNKIDAQTKLAIADKKQKEKEEKGVIIDLIGKYADAGITLNDSLVTAQSKLNKSRIYQDQLEALKPTFSTEFPDGSIGGQCGTFAHKVVDGIPTMGDLYTTKQATVDKSGIKASEWKSNPQVGDVLIFDTKRPFGHVAVVNSINTDGTVTLTESNYNGKVVGGKLVGDEKVTNTRKVNISDPTIYGALRGTLKDSLTSQNNVEIGNIAIEAFGTNNLSDNQKTALDIYNGTGSLSSVSTANNRQSKVASELAKLKSVAKKSGDIEGLLRSSAGGKDVDSTFLTSFDKAINVVGQISELQNLFNENKAPEKGGLGGDATIDLNPIWGRLRKFNPWDMNAQAITATLQATIPNLARGVYGEVGVLTDNDIANYTKTLPTLTSTEEVRKAVLGITIRSIQRAIENKLKTNANGGRDVSGYVDQYKEIKTIADSLLGEGDNNPLKLNIMNTPSANNPLGIDL